MKLFFNLALLALWSGSSAWGQSAARPPYLPGSYFYSANTNAFRTFDFTNYSAMDEKVPISQVRVETVPEWTSETPIEQAFAEMRSERYRELDSSFPRRITWFYPDDGCFARATAATNYLRERGYPDPAKLFLFGSLHVETQFAPPRWGGKVWWWYHVAPAYRVKDQIFVFDPTVDNLRPLLLSEWVAATHAEADGEIAVCGWETYVPRSSCHKAWPVNKDQALNAVGWYLDGEWGRVEGLGLQPARFLGEEPPWNQPPEAPLPPPPAEPSPEI